MTDQSWYPAHYRPDRGWPMADYSTMPAFVLVTDAIVLKLHERRAAFWRKARDAAFTEWAGVRFKLVESAVAYDCDGITLDVADAPGDIGGWADHETPPCSTDPACNCAWAWVDLQAFQSIWQSRDRGHLRYVIAHELGHTLGFGHGGDGVMQDPVVHYWPRVNAEEIAAIAAYWST